MTGQVDAINRLDPKLVGLVGKNAKLEIIRAPGGWHHGDLDDARQARRSIMPTCGWR